MSSRDHDHAAQQAILGFTLVELAIAIALVGVLASLAGINYIQYVEKARTARAIAELRGIALILYSDKEASGELPESLAGIAEHEDPWGNAYRYLKIEGGLPPGIASNATMGLPHVSAPPGGGGPAGGGGPPGGGGSIMASVRKDRFLVPINTDYDLYSVGADGQTESQLHRKVSQDDIIRASDGTYFGLAANF